ncbi:OmpH family outer membrane protein [Suttonella ornithocola]|uniref:Seventeen kilodalton protein n=1 Tax=Suttonella ornithocola TaxID=279832 RepID=A0A380MX36_9GAMM|nr:OmpH family outer membrane protein [Suttonella ornithocola]SUO97119.1 Seventeen kilodalton protein [Suttonella ornithocola]
MSKKIFGGITAAVMMPLCIAQLPENVSLSFNEEQVHMSNKEILSDVLKVVPATTSSLVKNVKLSNLRLGFVNFRRIMGTIPQLSAIRRNLDNEFSAQQQELLQSQKTLEALEQKVARHANDADYDTLTQQLIEKRREIARQDAAFRDNYSVRRNEEIAKLQSLVLDQIVSLAKEQSFDVILNDTGVLYVSEKADLTELVIERLDKLAHQDGLVPMNQTSDNSSSDVSAEKQQEIKKEEAL